jgi:hypothetical protein
MIESTRPSGSRDTDGGATGSMPRLSCREISGLSLDLREEINEIRG